MAKFTYFLLILLLSGTILYAQASSHATATATIVFPIGTEKTEDLNFGEFSTGAKAGTIVLSSDGVLTVSGGVRIPVNNESAELASFNILGTFTYGITLESEAIIIKRNSGNETMRVGSFTSRSSAKNLQDITTQTLTIGATLHVGAGQVAGLYNSGTPFSVTVNFN